ncbi:hypothetical protein [Natronorubrum sulfidifaciens]|uniref:Uncharacterized protein n=1 Tax=Natronorubrum sulfidifaciens JCM 14089 TaxID=1230460 RepID=L9W7F5_9EURY|nr:hypothetical protein [Natronorubrum sulfidifaciens]ELY45186.1 hypothetical protein C495_09595 [Natronorubrum sulfidifaciens JCM 14089]
MSDERSRGRGRALLTQTLVFVAVLLFVLVLVALFVVGQSASAIPLEAIPQRVSVRTVVLGAVLVVGAIALPAYLLAGWQSAQRDATRDHQQ